MLIDFLPLDLAVVAVSAAAMHAAIGIGVVWSRLRARLRTGRRAVSSEPSMNAERLPARFDIVLPDGGNDTTPAGG